MMSQTTVFDMHAPFNALPLLPPACDIETKAILKATIAARAAIAELRSEARALPDQELLIHSLTLVEAKDSSEIENIFTTHDKLYQADFLNEKDIDPGTKEVKRYRAALWKGLDSIKERPLTTNSYIDIVQTIKLNKAGIRNTPGITIKSQQGETIYTPPEGEAIIHGLLRNLDAFINNDESIPQDIRDIDPLIKMAVMHYQFEAIHPFADGNGRTGRILNILYLVDQKLLEKPILFLSRYIIENRSGYYKGLQQVTEKREWENWILYMLKAIEETSYETIARIAEIQNAMQFFITEIKKAAPKIYSKDLVEVLFTRPVISISAIEQAGLAKRATASNYLKTLNNIGLLVRIDGRKEKFYLNTMLYEILKK